MYSGVGKDPEKLHAGRSLRDDKWEQPYVNEIREQIKKIGNEISDWYEKSAKDE